MDNIVLDVSIGLVFIYLLYSLLATTINEFVAMIFAYRHRMLETAIEQMLDGKNYSYYWWDKVANGVLWIYHWISGIIKKNNVDINDFFQSCNINSLNIQSSPNTYIKRRKLNEKAKLFAASITNHPLYRRKSEQSILYKKPAYLTASAFSDILFDVLSNRRSAINATPILMSDIKTFVSNQLQNNPGLKSILNMYIEQANGDVQKFKLLLEDWFDDTMNRVSGWYKRQATKVLFVIGIVLAITFNVSTINIVHKLSVNKDLREAMTKSASVYVENANKNASNSSQNKSQPPENPAKTSPSDSNKIKKNQADSWQEASAKKDNNHKQEQTQTNSPNADTTDNAFDSEQQQINKIRKLYKDTISEVNMMMGLGWDFSKMSKQIKHPWLNIPYQLTPHRFEDDYFKVRYVLYESIKHPRNWLGFLITALAITLGAPFWFDLLNRFVNIRAGGNKPSEDSKTSGNSTASKTSTLNQKPSPNSFA